MRHAHQRGREKIVREEQQQTRLCLIGARKPEIVAASGERLCCRYSHVCVTATQRRTHSKLMVVCVVGGRRATTSNRLIDSRAQYFVCVLEHTCTRGQTAVQCPVCARDDYH